MAQVIVAFTVKDQVFPSTTSFAGYKVSVTGQTDQVVSGQTATFDNVVPGDYTATVVAVDVDGADVGGSQSATFNVPVPTVTLSVPDVVTVQVGP